MRAVIWFALLFGLAVAAALFAGSNPGTVTLFWPPWRIDLSLNLALLLLAALFIALHLSWRALTSLLALPRLANRWRTQRREQALYTAVLQALAHQLAGRYLRSGKAAQTALAQANALSDQAGATTAALPTLRALAHWLAAESAHALQQPGQRDEQLRLALMHAHGRHASEIADIHDGVQMRAARWALDEHNPHDALERLAQLPHGSARRTAALRLRLKATREAGQTAQALEIAKLLLKHRAFSVSAGHSLVRSLATSLLSQAHDIDQLQHTWARLGSAEHASAELAVQAAQRLLQLGGSGDTARQWLLPAWEQWLAQPAQLPDSTQLRLVQTLQTSLISSDPGTDMQWLARIEAAQQHAPGNALLQYLAGMVYMQCQLWGKAHKLLTQATLSLQNPELRRATWRALALLAQQRGDTQAEHDAWKQAAQT